MGEFRAGIGNSFVHRYRTVLNPQINHGAALALLAESSGFGVIAQMYPEFQSEKVHQMTSKLDIADDVKMKNLRISLMHMRGALPHAMMRIIFVGCLENCIQINIQTTLFSVGRALSGVDEAIPWLLVVSIITSIIACVGVIYDGFRFVKFIWLLSIRSKVLQA